MPYTNKNLHELFRLMPYTKTWMESLTPANLETHKQFRDATYAYANSILALVPEGDEREAAFTHLRSVFLSGAVAIRHKGEPDGSQAENFADTQSDGGKNLRRTTRRTRRTV